MGICWSTSNSPTTANDKTAVGNGTGAFTSNLTGLGANTTNYIRAYASNSAATAYGQEQSFKTDEKGILKDLLAFWKLDENSGTFAKDAAGNWGLSMVNNPTWTNLGKLNNAADLGTSSTRHLECVGVTVTGKNTFTLSALIYLVDELAEAKNIIGINTGANSTNSGAAEVKLILTTDNKFTPMYHTISGGTNPMQRIGGITIEKDKWHHVVGIIDNGNITSFGNGVKEEGNAVQNPDGENLQVGGRIDEAGIWARALTEAEVLPLYNNGNGLPHRF